MSATVRTEQGRRHYMGEASEYEGELADIVVEYLGGELRCSRLTSRGRTGLSFPVAGAAALARKLDEVLPITWLHEDLIRVAPGRDLDLVRQEHQVRLFDVLVSGQELVLPDDVVRLFAADLADLAAGVAWDRLPARCFPLAFPAERMVGSIDELLFTPRR